MKFKLTEGQLNELRDRVKLHGYLSSSLTKTYFAVGDNEFILFFHGVKGAVKTVIAIDAPDAKEYFQADYAKWNNALSKLGFNTEINFHLTDRYIKIAIDDSSMINLSINKYLAASTEAKMIESYISHGKELLVEPVELILTTQLCDALQISLAMFSSVGKNNAVALRQDHVLYADRSIVLQAHFDGQLDALFTQSDTIELHKFTAALLILLAKINPLVTFASDASLVYWDDAHGTTLLLGTEPCDIAIPSTDEINDIIPDVEDCGQLTVEAAQLHSKLRFFDGFYEASVWKPITFQITANKESLLYYSHPTTEITKSLDTVTDTDGSFIIGSEALSKLLSKAADVDNCTVQFLYDDASPGVLCNIKGSSPLFTVVFAKLVS